MSQCPSYTLSQIVDNYCIRKFNDKRKNYKEYLIIAMMVWKRLFWNTLFVTKSEWLTVQKGKPYNFIWVPKDCHIFIKCNIEDKRLIPNEYNTSKPKHCNTLVPLYYNPSINVIPQPIHRDCGCGKNCSILCEPIDTWNVTTKPIVIGNTTYYEKEWLKYCKNGDIIKYREIPTPSYKVKNTAGDFNDDYNSDYSNGAAFGNYTVVTHVEEEIICKLKTKQCGCPDDNEENVKIFNEFCGCHTPYWNHRDHKECYEFQEHINNHHYGEMKFSDDGTKIYLRGLRKGTKFVQAVYQTDGNNIDEQVLVPDYCDLLMYTGIDWESKIVNDRFPYREKMGSWYLHVMQVNLVIKQLNRISMTFLKNLQDVKIRF